MRRQVSLKLNTYTEGVDVDVAGISVKVFVNYPGRSDSMLYFVAKDELGTHNATERALVGNSRPKATERNYRHRDMARSTVRSQQRS